MQFIVLAFRRAVGLRTWSCSLRAGPAHCVRQGRSLNHSSIFAQMVLAAILMVTHFLIVGLDLYGNLLGDLDAGSMIASLVCVGSAAWLIVLVVIAGIKRLIRMIKK